ncbi:hypothetical protein GQ42DRAFT_161403 [Ramicandelaber brevisporus]|nr:hypothetical protein GQ42DRAFT_161403 [Ramicandelaber brevisporus]
MFKDQPGKRRPGQKQRPQQQQQTTPGANGVYPPTAVTAASHQPPQQQQQKQPHRQAAKQQSRANKSPVQQQQQQQQQQLQQRQPATTAGASKAPPKKSSGKIWDSDDSDDDYYPLQHSSPQPSAPAPASASAPKTELKPLKVWDSDDGDDDEVGEFRMFDPSELMPDELRLKDGDLSGLDAEEEGVELDPTQQLVNGILDFLTDCFPQVPRSEVMLAVELYIITSGDIPRPGQTPFTQEAVASICDRLLDEIRYEQNKEADAILARKFQNQATFADYDDAYRYMESGQDGDGDGDDAIVFAQSSVAKSPRLEIDSASTKGSGSAGLTRGQRKRQKSKAKKEHEKQQRMAKNQIGSGLSAGPQTRREFRNEYGFAHFEVSPDAMSELAIIFPDIPTKVLESALRKNKGVIEDSVNYLLAWQYQVGLVSGAYNDDDDYGNDIDDEPESATVSSSSMAELDGTTPFEPAGRLKSQSRTSTIISADALDVETLQEVLEVRRGTRTEDESKFRGIMSALLQRTDLGGGGRSGNAKHVDMDLLIARSLVRARAERSRQMMEDSITNNSLTELRKSHMPVVVNIKGRDAADAYSVRRGAQGGHMGEAVIVPTVIDLHHLSVSNALAVARHELVRWWMGIYGQTMYRTATGRVTSGQQMRIITGRGNHSVGGIARILPAVSRMLAYEGWRHSREVGYFIIDGRRNALGTHYDSYL